MGNTQTSLITVILGTGGTIAGRSSDPSDNVAYVAGEVGIEALLEAVPALLRWPLESEQVAQLDSKDMGFDVWQRLASRVAHHLERPEVGGVVITHGTDTLEETAWFLQSVLRPGKPVVLTCAMRPSTALLPDGPQNLLDAVALARTSGWAGVAAVCAGQIHSAQRVSKVHSYRLDAFDSGEAGPLGCIEEGVARWFSNDVLCDAEVQRPALHTARLEAIARVKALPRVALVSSHADCDGTVVHGLLALGRERTEWRTEGLVVACTGNGTVHADLLAALRTAQRQGMRVVRATRCARGRVIPSTQAEFPDSAGLSPVKARLALALDLLKLPD